MNDEWSVAVREYDNAYSVTWKVYSPHGTTYKDAIVMKGDKKGVEEVLARVEAALRVALNSSSDATAAWDG
jgi:hypothetical protein